MEAERINGETLIWVQSLKGYGQANLKSAKSFMHFDGDYRQLKSWKERFLMEHKKIKQDIQTRLMRECGGTGNHFLNPPRDYVPGNMKSGTMCVVCNVEFEVEDSLDEHIRSIHKDVVKKTFSKEAFEMVMKSEDYTEWLKKPSSKKTEGKKQVTVSQMQKTNQILVEKLNSKNPNFEETMAAASDSCDNLYLNKLPQHTSAKTEQFLHSA